MERAKADEIPAEHRVAIVTDPIFAKTVTFRLPDRLKELHRIALDASNELAHEFEIDMQGARRAILSNLSDLTIGTYMGMLRRLVGVVDEHPSKGRGGKGADSSKKRIPWQNRSVDGATLQSAQHDQRLREAFGSRHASVKSDRKSRRARQIEQEKRQANMFHRILLRFGDRDGQLGSGVWLLRKCLSASVRQFGARHRRAAAPVAARCP